MNDTQLLQALSRIIDAKTFESLKSSIVLRDGNEYVLFNKYVIVNANQVYIITRLTDDSVYHFSSLKYAVTWITLDKYNMVYEANRVIYLDIMLSGIDTSTTLYEEYLKKTKSLDTSFIYSNKISENNYKKRGITSELAVLLNKAKTKQLKRFSQSYNK